MPCLVAGRSGSWPVERDRRSTSSILSALLILVMPILQLWSSPSHAIVTGDDRSILIGLNANLSSSGGVSGKAIQRGVALAIDEINAAGGVLGRPFELLVKDHRGNPARGVDNVAALAAVDDLVAIVGGAQTPVVMAELPTIHEKGVIYLVPWAAGTGIIDNGYDANYVFRVSVRDEYAGEFLIGAALERGFRRPGLLLWQTAWGRSNEVAMQDALARRDLAPAPVQWFNTGIEDISRQLDDLRLKGADVVILVSTSATASLVVRDLARSPRTERLPVISHWGLTVGRFFEDAKPFLNDVDLSFLQTFSFRQPPLPERAADVLDRYCATFKSCSAAAGIPSPAGTAHGYDLVHLLKQAIEKAGTSDRARVREAMETLGRHEGLVRVYDPPFTPTRHDALDISDFRLGVYDEHGAIVPDRTM